MFFQLRSDLYPSKIFCLKVGTIRTSETVNNASNSPVIESDFISEFVKASQDNTLGTICCLPGLWRISILNL